MESRDWFVLVLLGGIAIAATVFLFLHPSEANFGIWAGALGTLATAFHWLVYLDSKRPDAERGAG